MEITALKPEDCWRFLGANRLGRLGCAKENKPYVVPLSFAAASPYLFAFTTEGKKTDYLKANSLVCIQFDEIESPQKWVSVLAQGNYEKIDKPSEQEYVHQLLQKRAMWWQPGYVATNLEGHLRAAKPHYFRVLVGEISGRRGVLQS